MRKKILILTSQKTGGGHRSSSNAVKAAILALNQNVDVNDFDSMEFMPGYKGEDKGYTAFTTRFRYLWKLFFEFTSLCSGMSNFFLYKTIFKRFKKLMEEYKPDLILSVNPCVVGSVRKSLKKMRSNVPLCTCIIDLVKHSRLWWDKKGAITFVPTKQMYDFLLKKGFARERLVHSGFPINEKFDKINRSPKTEIATPAVLMVSPSLKGNRASLRFVLAALRFNVNLTVVTGGNAGLKKYLDKKLAGIKNVSVCGYVFDMDKRLAAADVLVAKAGPNMILEAVKMCVPVLISGHILGQEEKNYRYITDNRYGLSCGSPKKLGRALALLFENDYKLLKEISHNQQSCPDTCGAKTVAERLVEALDK